jgi:hypothetical protein
LLRRPIEKVDVLDPAFTAVSRDQGVGGVADDLDQIVDDFAEENFGSGL